MSILRSRILRHHRILLANAHVSCNGVFCGRVPVGRAALCVCMVQAVLIVLQTLVQRDRPVASAEKGPSSVLACTGRCCPVSAQYHRKMISTLVVAVHTLAKGVPGRTYQTPVLVCMSSTDSRVHIRCRGRLSIKNRMRFSSMLPLCHDRWTKCAVFGQFLSNSSVFCRGSGEITANAAVQIWSSHRGLYEFSRYSSNILDIPVPSVAICQRLSLLDIGDLDVNPNVRPKMHFWAIILFPLVGPYSVSNNPFWDFTGST